MHTQKEESEIKGDQMPLRTMDQFRFMKYEAIMQTIIFKDFKS